MDRKPKLIGIKPADGKDPISIEITEVEGKGGAQVRRYAAMNDLQDTIYCKCSSTV
jgi:hypothetical protein